MASSPYIRGAVLDIGNGGVICFDYRKASSITLADIAVDLLKHLKVVEKKKLRPVNSGKIKCIEANVMKLPFPKNSFDVVILFNVAHHLSVPSLKDTLVNIETAFKEISRVLRKDGVFLLSDNTPALLVKLLFDPSFEFFYWLLSRFNTPLPYFLSLKQIKHLLGKSGFVIKKAQNIKRDKKAYQPLLPWISPPGWLWDIILGNKFFVVFKK